MTNTDQHFVSDPNPIIVTNTLKFKVSIRFVNVFSWICQSLLHGFITVVARVCQKWSCISRSLPNQTKLKISKLIEVFASAVELM